jgi:MFS transporter, OFA family, oxalate/formate antiporter
MLKKKSLANRPFDPAKFPFFYGWMILVWGTIGVIMSVPGQTIGVSVFTDSLIDNLKISRDELSMSYMFGTIGSSFLLPWAGKQYDKYGVRIVAMVASIGLGLVLLFLSQVDRIIFQLFFFQNSLLIVFVMFMAFLLLRFFGQGVLTMVSRNMMAQWFDKRRGFATGFSNVFISLAFSGAPVFLFFLVESNSWRGAWIFLASGLIIVFPIVVLFFFRNKPEESGLLPDGNYQSSERQKKLLFPVFKEFTLSEVRRNYSFWIYSFMLAMQALYITAFTFHVISIFEEAGLTRNDAITIFQPAALVAVATTLAFSSLSDYLQLKYLYMIMGLGACIGVFGVIFLGQMPIAWYLIVLGNGMMGGMYSVLASVTWPRYFGRKHLGAISGQSIMVIVFASALGPILFSQSLTLFGSYETGGWICFVVYFSLTLATFRAENPQRLLQ